MRKFLIVVFSFVMIMVLGVTATAFDDMPNNWATPALESAVENGLLTGDGNLLKPDDYITRAQMATVMVRAFGAVQEKDLSEFTDVSKNAWYYSYLSRAYQMNIFLGDGAGHMTPDDYVTREQAFTVVCRVLCLEDGDAVSLEIFEDCALVSDWAKGAVSAMVENGYVNGSNGRLDPKSYITRAQFAQLMYNVFSLYIDFAADLAKLKDVKGNVVLRNAIPLENVSFEQDVVIGDGVNAPLGLLNFKNVSVAGRIVIRAGICLDFDGSADEIVSNAENVKLILSSNSLVSDISLNGSGSSIQKEADEVTTLPDTPPTDSGTEEDIWTDFH